MQLSRKRIIGTAIKLIEAEGVEAASMQRLATELGCGLISLYNHVPSKDVLLDGVADEVMSGIAWTYPPEASPQDQMRALVREVRQRAGAHPRCAMLALSRRGVPASLARPAETVLAALREAGFSGPDAVRIVRTFAAYLLGLLAWETGFAPGLTDGGDGAARRLHPAEFPQLTELHSELRASDIDGDFEFGAELFVRAVTARARAS
jgi:AcrR family transcriptional regulator